MSNSTHEEVPVQAGNVTAIRKSTSSKSNISPSRKRVNDIEAILHELAAGKSLFTIAKQMGLANRNLNILNRQLAIYGLQAARFLEQKSVTKHDIVFELANNPEIQKAFATRGFEATRQKVIETANVLEDLAANRNRNVRNGIFKPITEISKDLKLSLSILNRNISILDFGLIQFLEFKGVGKEVVHSAMAYNLDGMGSNIALAKAEREEQETDEARTRSAWMKMSRIRRRKVGELVFVLEDQDKGVV